MSSRNRYLLLFFIAGMTAFYIRATNSRRSEEQAVAQMSKKLQFYAHHVVNSSGVAEGRSPAGGPMVPSKTPRDRWVETFANGGSSTNQFDLKNQQKDMRQRQRNLAQKMLRSGTRDHIEDEVSIIRPLRAIPRAQLSDDDPRAAQATVLDSQWAIFRASELQDGHPVVYDFASDRWGILTGMVEVDINDPETFEDTVSEIQSRGYEIVRLPSSRELVYVNTRSHSAEHIQKVSRELKSALGSQAVKPEAIYVWRSPQ
jgi:hypothetical protein